jgi:hypothetical protein
MCSKCFIYLRTQQISVEFGFEGLQLKLLCKYFNQHEPSTTHTLHEVQIKLYQFSQRSSSYKKPACDKIQIFDNPPPQIQCHQTKNKFQISITFYLPCWRVEIPPNKAHLGRDSLPTRVRCATAFTKYQNAKGVTRPFVSDTKFKTIFYT